MSQLFRISAQGVWREPIIPVPLARGGAARRRNQDGRDAIAFGSGRGRRDRDALRVRAQVERPLADPSRSETLPPRCNSEHWPRRRHRPKRLSVKSPKVIASEPKGLTRATEFPVGTT